MEVSAFKKGTGRRGRRRTGVKSCINGNYTGEQRGSWLRGASCPSENLKFTVHKDHQ